MSKKIKQSQLGYVGIEWDQNISISPSVVIGDHRRWSQWLEKDQRSGPLRPFPGFTSTMSETRSDFSAKWLELGNDKSDRCYSNVYIYICARVNKYIYIYILYVYIYILIIIWYVQMYIYIISILVYVYICYTWENSIVTHKRHWIN